MVLGSQQQMPFSASFQTETKLRRFKKKSPTCDGWKLRNLEIKDFHEANLWNGLFWWRNQEHLEDSSMAVAAAACQALGKLSVA